MSLVCVDEHQLLKDIERLIKRPIPQEVIVGFEPDPTREAGTDPATQPGWRRRSAFAACRVRRTAKAPAAAKPAGGNGGGNGNGRVTAEADGSEAARQGAKRASKAGRAASRA